MTVHAMAGVRAGALVRARPTRWNRPSPTLLCFIACALPYLAAAGLLAFSGGTDAVGSDGMSRVEIANRILFSRDPHLAAIGFVWSPIPVLALLPVVALKPIWPFLVTGGFAGNIVSALFMAGAVAQLFGFLEDLHLRRRWSILLTAAFAAHPLILLYAANAMSEAPFLLFLILGARKLQAWLRTRETTTLMAMGIYLALAYLTRYEAAAAALAVAAVVATATFLGSSGERRERLTRAAADLAVALFPFVTAFFLWAVISWLITKSPFEQFSSAYGNQVQLQARASTAVGQYFQLGFSTTQAFQWVAGIEPFMLVAATALLAVTILRRSWTNLGAPVFLGGVLLFMSYAFVTRKVDDELRYFIVAIPLTIILLALFMTEFAKLPMPRLRPTRRRLAVVAASLLAVASMLVTVPFAGTSLLRASTDGRLALAIQAVLARGHQTAAERAASDADVVDFQVSSYIDGLHLPPGSVLLDDFLGFIIEMRSNDPAQYVITSDSDFQQVLADPYTNHVRYILVPSPNGLGGLDAVNRGYPHLYATGAGLGTAYTTSLVKTFVDHSDSATNWRLYRLSLTSTNSP